MAEWKRCWSFVTARVCGWLVAAYHLLQNGFVCAPPNLQYTELYTVPFILRSVLVRRDEMLLLTLYNQSPNEIDRLSHSLGKNGILGFHFGQCHNRWWVNRLALTVALVHQTFLEDKKPTTFFEANELADHALVAVVMLLTALHQERPSRNGFSPSQMPFRCAVDIAISRVALLSFIAVECQNAVASICAVGSLRKS